MGQVSVEQSLKGAKSGETKHSLAPQSTSVGTGVSLISGTMMECKNVRLLSPDHPFSLSHPPFSPYLTMHTPYILAHMTPPHACPMSTSFLPHAPDSL